MEEKLIQELQKKLKKERQDLKKELESFAKEDKDVKYNWKARYPNREDGTDEEEADETQEYDTLVSLEQSLEVRLRDVELALEKIKQGENYGKCEKCGNKIEEDRLLASPEAKLCVNCNK